MEYQDFLDSKRLVAKSVGFKPTTINPMLFPFQRDIVSWALQKGRAALFEDCGLGKTPQQLEWAHQVHLHTEKPVLILAPLAVSEQTVEEGVKFGYKVNLCKDQSDVTNGINITNYEKLDKFDASVFSGVVLDESSILKNFTGATRNAIIESFARTPYRLACTATPAPNDYMELGNHAEFLGVMTRVEMLSMFFVHDGGTTSEWRLKGHAQKDFWAWVCSWAVSIRKPSDIGYSDDGFVLPPLVYHEHLIDSDFVKDGMLLPQEASTLDERRAARRSSIDGRVAKAASLANGDDEQWAVWCDLNDESEKCAKLITDSVEVTGSDTNEFKAQSIKDFSHGKIRKIVIKPKIGGMGLNWQNCHNVACVGLSDSYEALYQLIRRCYRFGQTKPVHVHIITSSSEGATLRNIKRKEQDAAKMADAMIANMSAINTKDIKGTSMTVNDYKTNTVKGKNWTMHLGDCVEVAKQLPDNSIDYTVFSPPFASLYTYSNSERDMGNCKDASEFMVHFRFLVKELLRVTVPGRNLSFHCMNLPTSKTRDGVIGISDFRGELIRMFVDEGWIYHSEVCIWKDPVTAMQRTKALGLLHKQLKKDSCMSRQGIPDYLVTMRKPGDNPKRVTHTNESFPVSEWQDYASPVWMDIKPGDTLQKESAREDEDERHICPLQLEVIRRALRMWSSPGDTVLSPFGGIGSEGFVSLEQRRKFIGIELKQSYFDQACANLANAESDAGQVNMFEELMEGKS